MEILFDTHAHYFDAKFGTLEGGAEALLKKLFSENVGYILNASTTTRDSLEVLALADRYEGCYAAVGVHPENCKEEESVGSAIEKLKELLKHPKAVAIGEIGLDYHWEDNPPKDMQKEYFTAQLDLARETGTPVVIHDRDAHGDVFDILSGYRDLFVILHSFSGSQETARQYMRNPHCYISFSGVLTYKNAVQTVEIAKMLPEDRILIETDCPYLAPVPYRGKINHSGLMIETAKRLSEIRGWTLDETVKKTRENAFSAFKIR